MKNTSDFTDFNYGISVDDAPGTKVEVIIDSSEVTQVIKLTTEQSYELAQQLLSALGEKTTQEWEEECYELEREKDEFENKTYSLESRIESMRIHDMYIPF